MDINVSAPFYLMKMLMPFLQKAKWWVVNVSSILGNKPNSGYISYWISKAGL